jgi:hypothetical protein
MSDFELDAEGHVKLKGGECAWCGQALYSDGKIVKWPRGLAVHSDCNMEYIDEQRAAQRQAN